MPLPQSLVQLGSVRCTFLQGPAVDMEEGKMLSCLFTILVPVFLLLCYVVIAPVLKLAMSLD